MQRRQKTQRQRKYSVVWCHVVQILFYGFHSRWFTLFTNWVENWWKPSEISCPMCCKMALSKNKTMAPSFGTFLNFKIQKEISSLLLLQVLPFSLWPTPSIHLLGSITSSLYDALLITEYYLKHTAHTDLRCS